MADEHVPASSPQSSTGFSAPAERPPSADVNGEAPSRNGEQAPAGTATAAKVPEMVKILRMILGYLIIGVCGWGLIGLVFYLVHSSERSAGVILGVTAALDLVLFFFLERDFWLSRFMGLRIEPGSHPWHSAILLWLLGVPGLLFRSTDLHPQAEAAGRTATRTRTRPQPTPQNDSFREIVETIVFVVVLVLLLKSFAAEAFVIPTGSMAQTLLGYQKEVECPDCGIKFPINCSQEVDPNEGKPSPVYACVCPNCRKHIHFRSAGSAYELHNPESVAVDDPGWNSGDRVLVAKFVYDLFGKQPNRLDVVVFKFPGNPDFPASGPYKNHVPMNYIKRLIGLPGETIAIRGGNLYFLSPENGPRYDDYETAKNNPEMMATLWKKDWMHVNEARQLFAEGRFQIIRKNPENILSMMRLVYDNDHPSKDPKLPQRWTPDDRAWGEHSPHGFRIGSSDDPKQMHWLTYRNLLRDDGGQPSLIMDFMGYNTYQTQQHSPLPGTNWVGDLILECEANIEEPRGELMLELSKGVDRFRASWDVATGVCTLLRLHDGIEEKLDSKQTALSKKGNYRLRFANVDDRLTVWVDGELPFDSGVSYAPPQRIAPTEENDLNRPARIGVRGGHLAVRKLKLFRDTYYTVGGPETNNDPRESDVLGGIEPTNPNSWHKLDDPPVLTLYVQPDHFLCLGDNSPESSDGRAWGSVPRRLLLGRALLVYYPFGRAGRIR